MFGAVSQSDENDISDSVDERVLQMNKLQLERNSSLSFLTFHCEVQYYEFVMYAQQSLSKNIYLIVLEIENPLSP